MSEYTPNLNLFKYNTSTDGKEIFSITQALNRNWDIIDNLDPLPDQTDKAGYLLTTDGTNASWGEIEEIYPIIETYIDGTSWYRVYSNGWCEQGGTANVGANSQYNGTFLKPFKDTNICFLATDNASSLNGGVYGYQQGCGVSSNSAFYLRTAYDGTIKYTWQACGYIEV